MRSELFLPYLSHVDDSVIKCIDGSYLCVVQLAGLPFETCETTDLDVKKSVRNKLWRALSQPGLTTYYNLVRSKVEARASGIHVNALASRLAEATQEKISRDGLFTNKIYLTLHLCSALSTRAAISPLSQIFSSRSRAPSQDTPQIDAAASAQILRIARSVTEMMREYRPCVLGVVEHSGGIVHSQPMQFLGQLLNLCDRPYELPSRPIRELLATRMLEFGRDRLRIGLGAQSQLVGLLSVKEYSESSAATMLDGLLALPFELGCAQSFQFEDATVSEWAIARQQRRLRNTRDRGSSQIEALDRAMDQNKGEVAFGLHHCTIATWATDASALEHQLGVIDGLLGSIGVSAVRESTNLPAAFYAQLPANQLLAARASRISSRTFASFASCHNIVSGEAGSAWGAPVCVLPTSARTAHYFNFHVRDRGNTLIIGPTGSGKTVTMGFLISQSLRLGGRRLILDKDRGLETFVLASGGQYKLLSKGVATGWNPLQLPDTAQNRQFLAHWFEDMLMGGEEGGLSAEDRYRVAQVVASAYELPVHSRLLRHVAPLFGNPESDSLARRLLNWYEHPRYGTGSCAWIFDQPGDPQSADWSLLAVDMTQIIDSALAKAAVVAWIFHLAMLAADGQPLGIFVDEGWRLLDDPGVAARIEDIEYTIRKKNGMIALATQAPETLLASRIAPAVIQQSQTLILFPNPSADAAVYKGYLGLNDRELELIRRKLVELGTPGLFLVKNSLGSCVCQLDLRSLPAATAILSPTLAQKSEICEFISSHEKEPGTWLSAFWDMKKLR